MNRKSLSFWEYTKLSARRATREYFAPLASRGRTGNAGSFVMSLEDSTARARAHTADPRQEADAREMEARAQRLEAVRQEARTAGLGGTV